MQNREIEGSWRRRRVRGMRDYIHNEKMTKEGGEYVQLAP